MNEKSLRHLIRATASGRVLPHDAASKVSGRPAGGEICTACGHRINPEQLVMDGVVKSNDGASINLHVLCFELWNDERCTRREEVA
jgi:hypothetical protein